MKSLLKQDTSLRRADKNRVQGKIQIHEYLKVKENGRPKLQIFNTCPNLIRELQSIPLSKTNPEDVDTHASDHAYDALSYMIMSRPRMEYPLDRMRGLKRDMYNLLIQHLDINFMAENDNTFLNADNIYEDVEGEAGKSLTLRNRPKTNLVGIIKGRFAQAEDARQD